LWKNGGLCSFLAVVRHRSRCGFGQFKLWWLFETVRSLTTLGSGSGDLCTAESRKRAFLVHGRYRRKIENTIFLRCEAFSLTSRKDANGHQKGQAQFVGGYLSLLEPQ
jgi:hypothetical protein